MVEIRFHGRHGQPVGKVTRTLAKKIMDEDNHVQVFDSFGAFRPDNPMYSVLRISPKKIAARSANETTPDVVVVLDNSLFEVADITKGLKTSGIVMAYGVEENVLGEKAGEVKFIKLDPYLKKEESIEQELLQAFKQNELVP